MPTVNGPADSWTISTIAGSHVAWWAKYSSAMYELACSMRRTLRWFWPRAESVIYAEAKRLEAAGLATSRVEPAADGSRRTRTI